MRPPGQSGRMRLNIKRSLPASRPAAYGPKQPIERRRKIGYAYALRLGGDDALASSVLRDCFHPVRMFGPRFHFGGVWTRALSSQQDRCREGCCGLICDRSGGGRAHITIGLSARHSGWRGFLDCTGRPERRQARRSFGRHPIRRDGLSIQDCEMLWHRVGFHRDALEITCRAAGSGDFLPVPCREPEWPELSTLPFLTISGYVVMRADLAVRCRASMQRWQRPEATRDRACSSGPCARRCKTSAPPPWPDCCAGGRLCPQVRSRMDSRSG